MVTVDAPAAALFRALSGMEGRPTILFDGIDTDLFRRGREELAWPLRIADAAEAADAA
jgi:hypothetical protein